MRLGRDGWNGRENRNFFACLKKRSFGRRNIKIGNRAGQPEEIAPSFVSLASDDSSYITGQVLHPNGGTVVNG
jgi:NAD(P)-dependent dehydrogenase (short-subunit alcohol dehydrogenase family)